MVHRGERGFNVIGVGSRLNTQIRTGAWLRERSDAVADADAQSCTAEASTGSYLGGPPSGAGALSPRTRSRMPSRMRRSMTKPTGSSTVGPCIKRVAKSSEQAARKRLTMRQRSAASGSNRNAQLAAAQGRARTEDTEGELNTMQLDADA